MTWWNRAAVLKVQGLQEEILGNSEIQQGYINVVFRGSDWSWGNIVCRLTMSGAHEWDMTWNGYDDLIHVLEYVNREATRRGYRNER